MNDEQHLHDHEGEIHEDDALLLELLDSEDPLAEMEARGIIAGSTRCRKLSSYLATFGALAWGLEPRAANPEAKHRLLAAIGGLGEDAETTGESLGDHGSERSTRRRPWLLPLAAVLGLAAIALAVLAGWLWTRVEQQEATIAALRGEARELAAAQSRLEQVVSTNEGLESRLSLIVSRGVEICPLQPVREHPLAQGARGVLFIAADHEHWYLALEGLNPVPPGRVYQLWFITPEGPVSGGTFTNASGERQELSSSQMPDNTSAVAVTLEPAGGMEQPTGPQILWGDEAMVIS